MNPFRISDNLTSYSYPIVKILVCILLDTLLVFRNNFYHINIIYLRFVETLVCVCIFIASVLCIYISFAEIVAVSENRQTYNVIDFTKGNYVMYSTDRILSMMNTNDILDVHIIANGEIVKIGVSSNCKAGSRKFYDKLFFVGAQEFTSIEDFEKEIKQYSNSNQLAVISIDGIKTRND